jgi:hypothetical protein
MNVKDIERLVSNQNTVTSTKMQNCIRLLVPINREFSLTVQQGNKTKKITISLRQFQPNYKPRLTFTQHIALRHILLPCRALPCRAV